MYRHLVPLFFVLFLMVSAGNAVAAACDKTTSLDDWLQCRIAELQKKNLQQSAIEKQADQPSLSSASTSLLDKTSAPDLLGVAYQLLGAGGDASHIEGGSPTITFSAYALATASRGENPLDPAVYSAGKNWRRFSFTLGNESASISEDLSEARVFGGKLLVLDHRDVSSRQAQQLLNQASQTLASTNQLYNAFSTAARRLLYDRLGPRIDPAKYPTNGTPAQRVAFANTELDQPRLQQTLALLTKDELAEIDRLANETVVQAFTDEANNIRKIVSKIRTAPQFAISYTGKMRDRRNDIQQYDEHRFAAAFDYGLTGHTNASLNVSYEYRDSKIIGADKRGGRVAGELLFELNHDQAVSKGINPYTFSMSLEGKFLTKIDDTFRAQGKLVIPVANGISLPISATYSNRTELIAESDVRGQFGLTLDVSKLMQAFVK